VQTLEQYGQTTQQNVQGITNEFQSQKIHGISKHVDHIHNLSNTNKLEPTSAQDNTIEIQQQSVLKNQSNVQENIIEPQSNNHSENPHQQSFLDLVDINLQNT